MSERVEMLLTVEGIERLKQIIDRFALPDPSCAVRIIREGSTLILWAEPYPHAPDTPNDSRVARQSWVGARRQEESRVRLLRVVAVRDPHRPVKADA